MMLFGGIVLALVCGVSSAVPDMNWNLRPAAGRFTGLRPTRPKVQKTAAGRQEKQSVHEPISWRFPEPAEEEHHFAQNFELREPQAADSVSAVCGEHSVWVEAKKDLLGIGKLVLAEDVTLGDCPSTGEDPDDQVLFFQSELHGCGSQLQMSEDSFIYTFMLHYTPSPLGDSPIIRTKEVTVSIQCHYQRKHDVSSGLLRPTWSPFSVTEASDENLFFSFRLMTDDWQLSRPSAHYLLGDVIKFEVSVKQFHHVPLRVTVDSCVATVVPNVDTVPRYAFLGNNGCLFDSQLTGSNSKFLPRSHEDRLQFEVEAFRFQQDHSGVLYITCTVRATAAVAAVDATNKSCSFANGWREASGSHKACSCCDADCGTGSHLTGSGEWMDAKTRWTGFSTATVQQR
ncbi:zona pellucida sperm-binding protein 3-like, partial [Cottoperca gobio]|uniref:Zona pellucida sperm-binding protein 3 n=1 Tax=Cottoperca gobio TaxID=56716 RepID=A0A6J2PF59_COTGO